MSYLSLRPSRGRNTPVYDTVAGPAPESWCRSEPPFGCALVQRKLQTYTTFAFGHQSYTVEFIMRGDHTLSVLCRASLGKWSWKIAHRRPVPPATSTLTSFRRLKWSGMRDLLAHFSVHLVLLPLEDICVRIFSDFRRTDQIKTVVTPTHSCVCVGR